MDCSAESASKAVARRFQSRKSGPFVAIHNPRPWSLPDADDAVGRGKRKRLEQHRVHDAEHGDVGSDTERQHANYDRAKAGRATRRGHP